MQPPLILAVVLSAVLATHAGTIPAEAPAVTLVEDAHPGSVAFRLTTPALKLEPLADGHFVLKIAGFETHERQVGAPDIPTRTVLVAIPPGVQPRLEVRASDERTRPGVRPKPVPRLAVSVDAQGREKLEQMSEDDERRGYILSGSPAAVAVEDPGFYKSSGTSPSRVAWLGRTGVLRDQRYVEVHLAPVRFDPRIDGLTIQPRVDVVVHFDGPAPPAVGPAPADRFESVYRGTFVNYDQGRHFRVSAHTSAPAGSAQPAREAVPSDPRNSAISGSPRYRLRVSEDGLIRLKEAQLSPAGFQAHPISTWRLTNRGVQVPLRIRDDDNDDMLDPVDWVQFYAQALTDEPKAVLNTASSGASADLYEYRDVSDENVYFLTVAGTAQPDMSKRESSPATPVRPPEVHFEAVSHLEQDISWRPLKDEDPWYWGPSLNANTGDTRTETVALPGLFSATEPARFLLKLRSFSNLFQGSEVGVDQTHLPRVTVTNDLAEVLAVDEAAPGVFVGRDVYTHDIMWTHDGEDLTNPVDMTLEMLPVAGADSHFGILDWVEVRYRRDFSALDDELIVEWLDEDTEFLVTNLDTFPQVYEITLPAGETVVQPVLLTNGLVVEASAPYSVRFRVDEAGLPPGTMRRFLVTGSSNFIFPAAEDFIPDTVSTLRSDTSQADMIVIAHPDVFDDGPDLCSLEPPTGCLTAWLNHRASPQGGGLAIRVAMVEDVYDEFNDGLYGPEGIRNFLSWVMTPGDGWDPPKPGYVMLLGDGSFNPKDRTASGDFVPTQIMFQDILELGYYSSDNVMAAVLGGDQLADLVPGRIPARDANEANVMLRKFVDYEQNAPLDPWRRHVLLISDRGKAPSVVGESDSFEAANSLGGDKMNVPPYTLDHKRYWDDFCNGDPDNMICEPRDDDPGDVVDDSMNTAIRDAVNAQDAFDGTAIVQFVGHGNFEVWSDDAFFDERDPALTFRPRDTTWLDNGLKLPFMMAHNCLTGGFHITQATSVGEDWIKRDGGGSVASFAPSGLSFTYLSERVSTIVFDEMFGPNKSRDVGAVVLSALGGLCGDGSTSGCQNYVLQGDPAQRLQLPHVEPATGLGGTIGNTTVVLDWTDSTSPGPITYDVYRWKLLDFSPTPDYVRIATGETVSNYTDTGLENAETYRYYVIAVDVDGFESRWSNFNTGCPSSEDCVELTPLNPNPPVVPGGLAVEDLGTGDSLEVTWDANPEDDLAYYTVHVGTASMSYDVVTPVGKTTHFTLEGLTENQEYFVAVSATNTSSLESVRSPEKSETPVYGPGLHAPRFIDDLRADPSGSDIVLDWTPVATDVYGKDTSVPVYRVLRGEAPNFANEALSEIGTTGAPPYVDAGAFLPSADYFYRVVAVDGDGNESGFGAELPASTEISAAWSQVVTTDVVLTWDPVTSSLDGNPLDLLHYAVYESAVPVSREAIRDGTLPPFATANGTSIVITPPGGLDRFYSVLAVDIRGNLSPF